MTNGATEAPVHVERSAWDLHPSYSLAPAGFTDSPYDYSFSFVVGQLTEADGLTARLDRDTYFVWRGVQGLAALNGGGPGGGPLCDVRLIGPTGEGLDSDWLEVDSLFSTAVENGNVPIWPEVVVPPGGIVQFRGRETNDAGVFSFRVILNGVKRAAGDGEFCEVL